MDEKNYRSLDAFYKEKFGKKVFKVSLDAGLTCPNKDGSKGTGGCIFCNGSVAIGDRSLDLKNQFKIVRKRLDKKWPSAGYIAFLKPIRTLMDLYPILKKSTKRFWSMMECSVLRSRLGAMHLRMKCTII